MGASRHETCVEYNYTDIPNEHTRGSFLSHYNQIMNSDTLGDPKCIAGKIFMIM